MGSQAQVASWFRDPGPVFGEVAPEVIEDTLIHLATENEQYLSKLSDRAGCFKETQNLYSFCLKNGTWTNRQGTERWSYLKGHNGCLLPAKPLHQMCMQLLDFSYLTRDTIYDTLLKIAIENSTPSKLQVAKFLTVKEDFMLLAVGIISTSVFILNPGHWKQVVEHLNCITGITSQSILEFSYAVLKHIIGSTTPKQRYRNCGTKAPENRIMPLK